MAELPTSIEQRVEAAIREADVAALMVLKDTNEETARRIIADGQRFDSWEDFEAFRGELVTGGTSLALFERAADAIVSGDVGTLRTLLQQEPALVGMRSPRTHRATLLIYVGANGFESWRQRTPPNAVEVAQLLLDAGSEVDAVGAMYRGTTTLGLVGTS